MLRFVQRWHVAWDTGGEAALLSKGPPNHPQLSDARFVVLERGPAAHGWPDQKWTLSRIKTLIGRRFHNTHTIQDSVRCLLRRLSRLVVSGVGSSGRQA